MKKRSLRMMIAGFVLGTGLLVSSCKSKTEKPTNTPNDVTTVTEPQPTSRDTINHPVEISSDDALKNSVTDATKDFPGVKAEVNNGEITLTGDIGRSNLQKLMMSLNTLKPKKINNNLTIK